MRNERILHPLAAGPFDGLPPRLLTTLDTHRGNLYQLFSGYHPPDALGFLQTMKLLLEEDTTWLYVSC